LHSTGLAPTAVRSVTMPNTMQLAVPAPSPTHPSTHHATLGSTTAEVVRSQTEKVTRAAEKVKKSSRWRSLVSRSKRVWRKLEPWRGGGAGIGCGAGLGLGVTGGIGTEPTLSMWDPPRFVFGLGAGCGVGIGYGVGFGIGKRWDQAIGLDECE